MAFGPRAPDDRPLTPAEKDQLAAIRAADSLADLVAITATDSEHDAYFAAKRTWADLRGKELASLPPRRGLPGDCVEVDGEPIHVHGITHADTPAERGLLLEHVPDFLDRGAAVFCEQGIWTMYFDEFPAVLEMDDYRWAMARSRALGLDSHLDERAFDGLGEEISSLAGAFREVVLALTDSGGEHVSREFRRALGDVAADFLRSHADLATGDGFESVALLRAAAGDPDRLVDLQRYYKRTFLPQPLEREWLRRHDRELELVTHARNERMADYLCYHRDPETEVHAIVGAAHQPGVTYYLREYRDGNRRLETFED